MGGGYSNGYIPDSLLVTFNTGWNSTDGNWKHQLSPSSYVKHQALVNLARQHTGRTLTITEGWGAYRPYNIQVLARQMYGYGAATPGQSSHGGFWEGKQTLAIDYGNWGWVYGWDRAAFYRDVYACGLTPGLIHPSRGNNYPDEPWHVVDLAPWQAVAAGGNGVPFIDLALLRRQKENSMYIKGTSQSSVYNVWTDANGQVRLRLCLHPEASYANTGGLTVAGYDSTLTELATYAGYGQPIIPTVAAPGLEVIKIQDGDSVTYALWGPGYWDTTTDPELANGWARVYNPVAKNLTYAEWNDRKAIGTGENT